MLDAQEAFQAKGQDADAEAMEAQILKDADELALAQQDLALYESSIANAQPKV